jgi:hypothetical protein
VKVMLQRVTYGSPTRCRCAAAWVRMLITTSIWPHGYRAETRPHWQALGGSHAQRDLFEQVYIDALIQSWHASDAVPLLEARAAARPGVRVHRLQLGGALREGP